MRIETELGIRDYKSYTSRDITKKHNALSNYNYVYNHCPTKDDYNKVRDMEQDIDRNLYYPDDFYGITYITPNIVDNKMETYKNYYNGSNSSYSYSSDESELKNEKNIKIKERVHRKSLKPIKDDIPTIIPDRLDSLNNLTLQAVSSVHNTTDSINENTDTSDIEEGSHSLKSIHSLPSPPPISLWSKFNILGFINNSDTENSEECDKTEKNIEEV